MRAANVRRHLIFAGTPTSAEVDDGDRRSGRADPRIIVSDAEHRDIRRAAVRGDLHLVRPLAKRNPRAYPSARLQNRQIAAILLD
jgi:hypothetical protein